MRKTSRSLHPQWARLRQGLRGAARQLTIAAMQLAAVQPLVWHGRAIAQDCAASAAAASAVAAPAAPIDSQSAGEGTVQDMPGQDASDSADKNAEAGESVPVDVDFTSDAALASDVNSQSSAGDGGQAAGSPGGKDGNGSDERPQTSNWSTALPWGVGGTGTNYINCFHCIVLDPVDVTRADKPHVQVDYLSVGSGPLRLARSYHSNTAVFNARTTTSIGAGWRLYYDRSVEALSSTQVRLHRANGSIVNFAWNGASWVSSGVAGTLSATAQSWSYLNEQDTVENYDAGGRLTSLVLGGLVTTVQYDGAGRLWRVASPFGRSIVFGYDGAGRVSGVTLPDGNALAYGYDGSGNLVSVRFADGTVRQYLYENGAYPHALTGVIDESGRRRLTWTYDAAGRPNGGWYGNGVNAVAIQYNGATVTTADARNTQRTRTIGSVGGRQVISSLQTAATADSAAIAWGFSHDANGMPYRTVSRTGEVIETLHDARGLPYSETRALGTPQALVRNTVWHPVWHKPVQVSTGGVTFNHSIDGLGRITATARSAAGQPNTTVASRTFNAQGLLATSTDARAATTSYAYDALGNVTTITDAQGRVTSYQNYNAHGQAGRIVRADGTVIVRTFDGRGRLAARTDSGRTTNFAYDGAGRFASMTFPDGSWQSFEYTQAGHLNRRVNQRGEYILIDRDMTGAQTGYRSYSATGALTAQYSTQIDAVGRTKQVTDSRGYAVRPLYASDGRASGWTDALNRTVTLSLDPLGRPTAITQPNTAAMAPLTGPTRTTTHAYSQDGRGLHTATTDTNSIATNYGHDTLNRRASEVSGDAGTRSVSRNAAGDVVAATDARAVTTTRTLDALGRITAIVPAAGAGFTFGYVPNRSDSLLAQMTYPMGSTSWTYDAAGRTLTKTQTIGGTVRQISVARDALGRPATLTYPSGMQVGVTYSGDAVNAITVNGTTLLSDITYRPFSQVPIGWRWGNGSYYTRGFDLDGRITNATLGPVTRSYSYDPVGRVSAQSDAGPGVSNSTSLAYDEANQLRSYSGPQGSATFAWDTNGNRQSEVLNGSPRSYAYEPGSNRLSYIPGVRGMSYNTDGNPLADDGTGFRFTYDGLQRLVETYRPQGTSTTPRGIDVQESYDALGMRVFKSVMKYTASTGGGGGGIENRPMRDPGEAGQRAKAAKAPNRTAALRVFGTTQTSAKAPKTVAALTSSNDLSGFDITSEVAFLHDDSGHLLGEYDPGNSRIQETIWFAGVPVATVQRDGSMYYVHSDNLGTPRSVTRPSDNLQVWRWDSEPFGSTAAWVHPSFYGVPLLFSFNLRFAGQYFDTETGYHYNWMRHYDPRTGRYLEADPLGLGGGLSRYSYVGGNPLSGVDPAGLQNIVIGVGGTYVPGVGAEGSFGIYLSKGDAGFFSSGGVAAGALAGVGGYIGYIKGDASNINSPFLNVNVSAGLFTVTIMLDPNSRDYQGFSIGPAAKTPGASVSYTDTGKISAKDLWGKLFDWIGSKPATCP